MQNIIAALLPQAVIVPHMNRFVMSQSTLHASTRLSVFSGRNRERMRSLVQVVVAFNVQEQVNVKGKLSPSLEPLDMASADEDSAKQTVCPIVHHLNNSITARQRDIEDTVHILDASR